MRALAWGSTHAKELTVFGCMMYLLFSHGPVIPKKMDFRHRTGSKPGSVFYWACAL